MLRPYGSAITGAVISVALIAGLQWGRPVLIPIATAALVALLLNPVVKRLESYGINYIVSVLLTVTVSALIILNRFWHPLFALLASATRQDLARQIAYLKEENRILRTKLPKQISVTTRERNRLVKVGSRLGAQFKTDVNRDHGSFLRWVRRDCRSAPV